MKGYISKIIILLLPMFFACVTREENKISSKTPNQPQPFDCNSLTNKKVIFEIARSIIDKHDNEYIWNLGEIDTTDYFTIEDHFINATTKNRLVLIGGEAGLSAGSANHLLILFSCTDTLQIVWAEQTGDFTAADITDIDGDGIKEIVSNTGGVWMGECFDNYNIYNYKDGKRNTVFSKRSFSLIGCGHAYQAGSFKQGDTLENSYNCSLQKLNDKSTVIQQIQKVKIYQGGETEEEITNRLKVVVDTTEVRL